MAINAKHPHIRIDQQIWDDPLMINLSPTALRSYIFAIAWSKCQEGRTPDGILTKHGIGRIGATEQDLADLVQAHLMLRLSDGNLEILKYSDWQVTSEEAKNRMAIAVESGRRGAQARWDNKELPPPPPLEPGFDVEQAFQACFDDWPKQIDRKMTEKRDDALAAFRSQVSTTATYDEFCAAFRNRVRTWKRDERPVTEKRQFLGAFKNFCTRWRDWLPENYTPATTSASKPETKAAPGGAVISTFTD